MPCQWTELDSWRRLCTRMSASRPSCILMTGPGVVPLIAPYSQVEPALTQAPLPEVPAQESWMVPPPGASPSWPQASAVLASAQTVYPAPPGLAPSSATEWTLPAAS